MATPRDGSYKYGTGRATLAVPGNPLTTVCSRAGWARRWIFRARRATRIFSARDARIVTTVGNELCHAFFEYGQRYGAEGKNRVVEFALVERCTQPCFRFLAMPSDLQLAEFVSERLTGPGDVTLDFRRNLVLGECGVPSELVHGALATPAELMDAGVAY